MVQLAGGFPKKSVNGRRSEWRRTSKLQAIFSRIWLSFEPFNQEIIFGWSIGAKLPLVSIRLRPTEHQHWYGQHFLCYYGALGLSAPAH